jgi:hypothetical protein
MPDWRWSQAKLLGFLNHRSLLLLSESSWLSESSLGLIDVELVFPQVHKLAKDPELAALAEECLDDIKSRITI